MLVLAMVHLSFLYILTRYVMRAFLPYLLNRGAKYEYIGVKGRTNESGVGRWDSVTLDRE